MRAASVVRFSELRSMQPFVSLRYPGVQDYQRCP
jgi:hypothetical protein